MSYSYGPLASKAVQLIAKFGAQFTIEMLASPDPADADKPWRGPDQATSSFTPKGVLAEWDKNQINGDLIRADDRQMLVAGQDPEVLRLIDAGYSMDDVKNVVVGGVALQAMNIKPLQPGDTMMLYTLRIRIG